ncbi:hypothetical protein [Dietzia sp. ANT_WB102]|uniref:hypothetical protein n=1 Tax=Dietzia sp. ANT_WB102 TaxID=2597345 RepID=UPI0011ECF8AA|nr:hypothetical protein [Dietzia sp. ANT_WB102]KAA0919594.1 hypothetical protein FQ137_10345 [Dietzia sp. ANT_WB102]
MSVLEMQPDTRPIVQWTEVCPDDHRGKATRAVRPDAEPAPVRFGHAPRRTATGPEARRPTDISARTEILVKPRGTARPASVMSVAPGRRVLVRPAATDHVRACHIAAPAPVGVVDDVPAWALLACGIAFGIIMLLAVAFLGGPAYA